jgi:hypothetical protein
MAANALRNGIRGFMGQWGHRTMVGLRRSASNVLSNAAISSSIIAAGASFIIGIIAEPPAASALPSFARQTGQPCSACHTTYPQLTPYGREFKLRGYTGGYVSSPTPDEPGWMPALSFMATASYTHTQAPQPLAPGGTVSPNDNLIFQQASVWYGGAITNHLGIMLQGDYFDANVAGFGVLKHQYNWDMLDLRYANEARLDNLNIVYGATLNNQPGVQDVWSITGGAWNWPFVTSTLQPMPMAKTLIEGAFTQRVLGGGVYAWINSSLYLEASGYQSLTPNAQNSLGIDPTGAPTMNTVNPYFRVALEQNWGHHTLEIGALAFLPNVQPFDPGVVNTRTDHYTDIGVDSQYQYSGENYWLTVRSSYYHENQKLNASQFLGLSANLSNQLNSFRTSASLSYGSDNIVELTGGYFNIWGSQDMGLYMNSPTFSPNSSGWIGEIAYVPFGVSGPKIWPWANARIGLQYTWYDTFNGASGASARDNNTLAIYTQFNW